MPPVNISDMMENAAEAEAFLALLANRHRLLVLCRLVESPNNVGELQNLTGLSQSAVSQHLAKLRSAGLIEGEREGQSIRYSIASSAAQRVIETLYEIFCAPAPLRERIEAPRR